MGRFAIDVSIPRAPLSMGIGDHQTVEKFWRHFRLEKLGACPLCDERAALDGCAEYISICCIADVGATQPSGWATGRPRRAKSDHERSRCAPGLGRPKPSSNAFHPDKPLAVSGRRENWEYSIGTFGEFTPGTHMLTCL